MSYPHTSSQSSAFRPAAISRTQRLGLTLGLTVALVAMILLVLGVAPLLAAPGDTRISQRIQNSMLTTGTSVTATYGEALTVTMRFTVTAGTYLTGPITVSTRFAGWSTPSNQYRYRFLEYQGPLTVAAGTPDLTGVNFVSSTLGTTTYLTWTFDAIDNSAGVSAAVYELPYQVRLVWDEVKDTGGVTNIPNTGSTTIAWTGAGTQAANALIVTPVKPNLAPPNARKTYTFLAGPSGETLVVYTVVLTNGTSTSPNMNPSPAYHLAVTDSLDARLVYSSAWPLPASVNAAPDANTILVWDTPDWTLAPNATWTAYITATVPPTAVNAIVYTNIVESYYATQPGLPPDSAAYTSTVSAAFTGGVTGRKIANPTTRVRIGDAVTYTVLYTLTPAIYLNSPVFTDTLPLGFHYRPGTFAVAGDATLSGSVITITGDLTEALRWQINDVPATAATRYITFTYIADVDGLNTAGAPVYATNLQNQQAAVNVVQISWQDTAGVTQQLTANSTTQIAQPYLVNPDFKVGIVGWSPFTAPFEIGSAANYTLSLRNSGPGPAYEIVLSNTLPDGVIYQGNIQVQPITLPLIMQPTPGATGVISFVVQQLPPSGGKATISFDALVGDTARPGDPLVSQLSLVDYSSQPGGLYDGNSNDDDFTGVIDRHYSALTGALPAPTAYTFTLRGLTAVKTDAPDPVQPGQVLTYSIAYSNTSSVITATNATLIDTYDPHLIYLGAVGVPAVPTPVHDQNARTLTWNAGTLGPNSANARITATFQVKAPIDPSVQVLTNTIASDWSSPAAPVSRLVTTTLWQPIPAISLDDRGVNVQANQLMTYTLIYSNAPAVTGATTGTFTITLNYAPYVTFITSTGRLPIVPDGTIFTDTLGPGISRTVNLRMQVARPLPYHLTSFTSTATIYQPNVDVSSTASEETPVWLPRYELVKLNSSPANPPIGPGELIGYRIFVTNTGEVTGTNIVISDVWDVNTHNQALSGNWTDLGTYGVYTIIASLPPLASVALDPISMNVVDPLPNDVQLIRNAVYLTSTETTQQGIHLDTAIKGLYIQKTHTPDPVYPGNILTYTIAYTMYGTPSTSPVITDYLPAEVAYLSCAVDNTDPPYFGTCTQSNHVVVWAWNTLPQNATGIVTVTVQAPVAEWLTLVNNYASDSASGAPYRNGPPDLTYVGIPKMSVGKQASTAVTPPAPGDWIRYNLVYTNSGSFKATGVIITDTVPANTSYTTCSPQPCGESGGVVTWNVSEVPVTTTRVLTMLVQIEPNAGNTTIVNSSYGLAADRGIFNLNVPNTVSTVVVRPALAVSKSAVPSWIIPTGLITYTVRYTNTGGGLFTSLNFVDPLYVNGSATTPFQSASPNCQDVSNTVFCAASNLAPGASQEFTLTVKGNGVSNNEVITNAVTYWASNQTETLPEATTAPSEVMVSNAGAAADFSGTPRTGPVPLNVTFINLVSVTGSVSITGCQWDFGDGTPVHTASCQPGNTVQHTYYSAGAYPVALTINTNSGSGTNTRTRVAYIVVQGEAAYGVQLNSPQTAKQGARGTPVIYTLFITNTGSGPDSFTLSLPISGYKWVTNLNPNSTGTLPPGGSTVATATVNVGATGPLIDSDIVTVTATSNLSSTIKSSLTLKTSTLAYPVYLPLILR